MSHRNYDLAPAVLTRGLSANEVRVLELAELRNADIALVLRKSTSTVKAQLHSAMAKLNVETRTAAYARWLELRKAA